MLLAIYHFVESEYFWRDENQALPYGNYHRGESESFKEFVKVRHIADEDVKSKPIAPLADRSEVVTGRNTTHDTIIHLLRNSGDQFMVGGDDFPERPREFIVKELSLTVMGVSAGIIQLNYPILPRLSVSPATWRRCHTSRATRRSTSGDIMEAKK